MSALPNVRPELAELAPWAEKDPLVERLREAIGNRVGIAANEVVVGQGAASLIGAVANAFAARTSRAPATAMAMTPSLKMYKWALRARGMKLIEVPLDASFHLDVAMLERATLSMKPNLLVLGSPNDPTGTAIDGQTLERALAIAESSTEPVLVLLDESAAAPNVSLRAVRSAHASLAILRTLVGADESEIAWLEIDAALAVQLDKMLGFTPDRASLRRATELLTKGWDSAIDAHAQRLAVTTDLARAIAEIAGFSVTASAARFLWIALPETGKDAAEVIAAADAAGVQGLSRGGVGRLARRLRLEASTAEHAGRIVDLLKGCTSS